MALILVSIIGDQPAPNIFLIRDKAFQDVDEYLFLTTEIMESRARLDSLIAALDIPYRKYQKAIISPDDLEKIAQQLSALNLDLKNQYFVNLSSGSKIMAVGIFNFFTQTELKTSSKIFYVPIRDNAFYQIWPGAKKRISLSHKLELMEYLRSYDLRVKQSDFEQTIMPNGYHQRILDFFLLQNPKELSAKFWNVTKVVRSFIHKHKTMQIPFAEVDGLITLLNELEIPFSQQNVLRPRETHFLTAGWFEEWVYHKVKTKLNLDHKAIGRNIEIDLWGNDSKFGNNEFDLIFLHQNTLYVVECKTGLGAAKEVKQQFNQAIHRLAALRKAFGLRVQTVFITLSTRLRGRNGKILEPYALRAELLGITLIDRLNISVKLEEYLDSFHQS